MPSVGTTHHVEIGGHYYMVRPGSYLKKSAPQFGARFDTGDPDFNNLSFWQHWAQRCFIGGTDQDLWADDAMYDEGIGLNTTEHEKVTLSRDLVRGSGSNWVMSSGGSWAAEGHIAFVYNSILYVVGKSTAASESRLWRYDPSTDGWVRITSLDSQNIAVKCVAVFDGKVFLGGGATTTAAPKVIYDDGALGSWSVLTNPSGIGSTTSLRPQSMHVFQQKMYVAYGTRIWRLKDDLTWDGNTVFYKANASSTSNYISAMEVHLGFLYMLSQNGHVHRTDGNSTFDIWNWDGQTEGMAIRSFDGRLFIVTFEFTNTTDIGYGAMYQMSGSAVTLLKRWGDENRATRIFSMRVFDRRLFYGASNLLGFGTARDGFGVGIYDPIEDAHSIIASGSDDSSFPKGSLPYTNWLVDDVFFWQGKMFAFIRGYGAFFTPYKPNDLKLGLRRFDITSAGGSLASQNGGWLSTSTYDAGTPGVKKLWRKIVVDCTIVTNTGIVVEYSVNNGTSYTVAGTLSTVAGRKNIDLWIDPVPSTSLKLRFTLRSTSATATPTFFGYVVSYLPVIEPNWQWSMTLVLSDKQVLLDGTESTVSTETELTFLSNLWRSKVLTTFTDAEGVSWATGGLPGVLISDITFALRDLNQPLEGEVTVTLIEAVEAY